MGVKIKSGTVERSKTRKKTKKKVTYLDRLILRQQLAPIIDNYFQEPEIQKEYEEWLSNREQEFLFDVQ